MIKTRFAIAAAAVNRASSLAAVYADNVTLHAQPKAALSGALD